jgi:type IV secretory pathway VirB10-like protein
MECGVDIYLALIYVRRVSCMDFIMTIDELLSRAKQAIESGEKSMRTAAEDIVAAQLLGATQRQIARAIGKSAAWVNRLLRWRESGYRDQTAFGPQSKASRQRAKHRVQSPERKKDKPATTSEQAQAATAQARAATAKAEAAKARAGAQKAKADAAKARAEARKAKEQAKANESFSFGAFGAATRKLEAHQRDLLVKLLGMLGSAHAGERSNAANLVERKRVSLGMTWDELIVPATAAAKACAA